MRTDKNKEIAESAIAKLDAAKRTGNRRAAELRMRENVGPSGSASTLMRSSSIEAAAPKRAETSDIDMFESLLQPRSSPHAKSATRRAGKRTSSERDDEDVDSKGFSRPETGIEWQLPAAEFMAPQTMTTQAQIGVSQTPLADLQDAGRNAGSVEGTGHGMSGRSSGLTSSGDGGVFPNHANPGEEFQTRLTEGLKDEAMRKAPDDGLLPVADSQLPDSPAFGSGSGTAGLGLSDLLFRPNGELPQPEDTEGDHGGGAQSGLAGGQGINASSVPGQQVCDVPDSFELMLNSPVMGEVQLLAVRIPAGWRVQLRLSEFEKAQWLRERHGFVQRGLSRNLGTHVELEIVD